MDNTDRELLEKAAKAAGMAPSGLWRSGGMECEGPDATEALGDFFVWNPLTDDGDALRLAVRLQMRIAVTGSDRVVVSHGERIWDMKMQSDLLAATRRGIVLIAAAIGDPQ